MKRESKFATSRNLSQESDVAKTAADERTISLRRHQTSKFGSLV